MDNFKHNINRYMHRLIDEKQNIRNDFELAKAKAKIETLEFVLKTYDEFLEQESQMDAIKEKVERMYE